MVGEGGTEWTRDVCRESGVGGPGKTTERTATKIPVLSHSHTAEAIFLRQSTIFHVALA